LVVCVAKRTCTPAKARTGATVAGHFLLAGGYQKALSLTDPQTMSSPTTPYEVSRTRHPFTGIHRNANQSATAQSESKAGADYGLNCDTTSVSASNLSFCHLL
ncbi:MAG: hypothetical protein KDI83_00745, partial [Gammaproteobacteria bacterium]|nr:hypothetical protein [Gammaproteobacteria bacterium]